jgi:hypothetical protein
MHAGIHMHRRRPAAAAGPPQIRLGSMIEHGYQPAGAQVSHRARQGALEHIDGSIRQLGPQTHALFRAGHEEVAATALPEGAGHRRQAKAIGIGLDYGPGDSRGRMALKCRVVRAQGAQVDAQPCAQCRAQPRAQRRELM